MNPDDRNLPEYPRIVAQRLRNRIIESLESVRDEELSRGFGSYFESLFDFAPYEGPPDPNEAMSPQEFAAWSKLLAVFQDACKSTPRNMSDEAFVATGWPSRLSVAAKSAVEVFELRGRMNEDVRDNR